MCRLYEAIISLGSNTSDALKKILDATSVLESLLSGTSSSGPYFTPPLSGKGPDYCNAVVRGRTSLPAISLQEELKRLEIEAGRNAETRTRGEVPLDLDLVILDGVILRPADAEREYFRQGYEVLMNNRN